MNTELLRKCVSASFDGSLPFPEIVRMLEDDGAEWYSANLFFGMTTCYPATGAPSQVRWPIEKAFSPSAEFDSAAVESAIRASRLREITYPEFLDRISDAGVTYYTVHMKGRKAIYHGRHGDFHVEPFPVVQAPPKAA